MRWSELVEAVEDQADRMGIDPADFVVIVPRNLGAGEQIGRVSVGVGRSVEEHRSIRLHRS